MVEPVDVGVKALDGVDKYTWGEIFINSYNNFESILPFFTFKWIYSVEPASNSLVFK